MPRLTLRLLGPPLVELDGHAVQLGRHKAVALLAYLALTRQPHSRDALATLLWPELDQSHARGQLRRTLSLLNRTLGREWLAVDRETVEWAAYAEAWIDVDALRECLAACAAHGHPPQETCPDCVPLLAGAVDLYRDGFLAGFTLPDAPAFDEWQFFEGEGLRDEVSDALQRLATWYGGRGEYESAIPYARRWLALDALHEPAQRELMALYARSGQRAAALRQYAECERILGEELGVPPSPETVELYEAIRARQGLSPDIPAAGVDSPEPSARRHNLPAQLTPFVGRDKELDELDRLLAPAAEARLVTVVGPGGMGKTRLALEAASRQLGHCPDGVWFAPLAPVQQAASIVPTIAQALGVAFYGGGPPDEQLLRYLREKRMLLVLDNFEHLLAGVDLLVEILRTAPGLRLLVTSRARLNARGEQVFVLEGMAYPELPPEGTLVDDERRCDSVALFERNAQRVRSGFELTEEELPHVARICYLAQGMPLAILLAAAWVPALTPAEIAAEMERSLDFLAVEWRDEPERHQSMRAVFDATWGMLTENERQVFARLSVFRGGFTREAAEAVAGTDLRTLIALVKKSLLQRNRSGRYEIHELMRQYGEEKLGEVPEQKEEALDRHSSYYIEFLAHKEADLWSGYLGESLHEIDNIGAAWRRATAQSRTPQIHRSMGGLFQLCQGPGLLHEGEAFYADAVKALRAQAMGPSGGDVQAVLGLALAMQAFFAAWYGYVDRADRLAHEGLSILRGLDARREVALGSVLGVAATRDINPSESQQILKESLSLSRKLSCYPAMLWALPMLAAYALAQGVTEEAEQYASEALAVARRIDDRYDAAMALALQGHIAYASAKFALARERYTESLALFQEARIEWAMGRLCSHLGDTAMVSGDLAAARTWHRRALATYRQIGADWRSELPVIGGCWGVPVSMQRLGDVALAEGNGRQAKAHYRQALQRAMERPYTELCLHLMLGPAQLYIQRGNPGRAAELAALARHHPVSVTETRDRADELLERLRSELSPDVCAAAEARGQARDLEVTIHELLDELGPATVSEAMPSASSPAYLARTVDTGGHGDA